MPLGEEGRNDLRGDQHYLADKISQVNLNAEVHISTRRYRCERDRGTQKCLREPERIPEAHAID
jgi:hypothetical protein